MKLDLNNVYNQIDNDGKSIINMYVTARQFKNAILINEMVSLPNTINGQLIKAMGKQTGFDIFSTSDNKIKNKMFPFLVNKAFACEVYLKLILKSEKTDLDELITKKIITKNEKHELLSLLNLIKCNLKNDIIISINSSTTKKITVSEFDDKVKKISNVFAHWRYIYEKVNGQDNIVEFTFLNVFCEYLDLYTKALILKSYKYNVDEDIR